jgi:membrane protein
MEVTNDSAVQNSPSMWDLLKTTLEEWNTDNAAHLAAALAYYTIFSLAPLLVISIAIASTFLGRETVQGQLITQVDAFLNNENASTLIQTMITNANQPGANLLATIVGIVILVYGATNVFYELKQALNLIWDVPAKAPRGLWQMVLNRLVTLAMVLLSGFLLVASLIISTLVAAAKNWLNMGSPGLGTLSEAVNFAFFFLITVLIFALIYKFVPDVHIAWRDVWIGALATALLFSVGRLLISWYLSYSTVASTYGAAGSLAILLIWIYYSAQTFFLGAEFTQVYGRTYGSRWRERGLLADPNQPAEATEATKQSALKRLIRLQQAKRAYLWFVDLGIAIGVIGIVSLVNIAREPWRK